MDIGIAEVDLKLDGVRSLKEKRKIIKSIITRINQKFNLSVAEIEYQDKWQRSLLGLAVVGNDKSYLNQILDKAVDLIEEEGDVYIIEYKIYFC